MNDHREVQDTRQRQLLYIPAATGTAGDVLYEVQCTPADVTAGICASPTAFTTTSPNAVAFRAAMDEVPAADDELPDCASAGRRRLADV